jgi:hypothetical protein
VLNFLCQGDIPVKNPRLPVDSPKKTTDTWKNRNISSSKKIKRKMRKNQGASHTSDTTGRNIPGCKVGPRCKCKRNKSWSLLRGGKPQIFINYWNLGDFNIENVYLFSCVKATRPKQVYPKKRSKSESSRRSSTFSYHAKVEGSDIRFAQKRLCHFTLQ